MACARSFRARRLKIIPLAADMIADIANIIPISTIIGVALSWCASLISVVGAVVSEAQRRLERRGPTCVDDVRTMVRG